MYIQFIFFTFAYKLHNVPFLGNQKVLLSNQNFYVFLKKKTGKIAGERNKKLRKTYSLVHTGKEEVIAHQFLHQNSRELSKHALSHTWLLLSSQRWSKASSQEPSCLSFLYSDSCSRLLWEHSSFLRDDV